MFFPVNSRMKLLHWAHDSKLFGHPGIHRTLTFLSHLYWWSNLHKDVKDFVKACPVFAHIKSSNQASAGPLSHCLPPGSLGATLYGFYDLPPSKGCTVVWVAVDRFSKMAQFVPIPSLQCAAELVPVFICEILRLHRMPISIV